MRVAVAACVALVAFPSAASADCGPNPPADVACQQAAAVFVGRVVSAGSRGDWRSYEFDVAFAWKGVTARRVAVLSGEPGCGRGCHFKVGQTYLVYAQSGLDGLTAHSCSRTEELATATEDLAALGRPPHVFPVAPAASFPWQTVAVFGLGLVVGGAAVACGRYWWSRRTTRTPDPVRDCGSELYPTRSVAIRPRRSGSGASSGT
jgi:hypothetical protein